MKKSSVTRGKNLLANPGKEITVVQLIELLEKVPPNLILKSNFLSCDGLTRWDDGTITLHEIEES